PIRMVRLCAEHSKLVRNNGGTVVSFIAHLTETMNHGYGSRRVALEFVLSYIQQPLVISQGCTSSHRMWRRNSNHQNCTA
ncbi:hypothetical protein COCVIDRAFT_95527, partial [Bipolaris victoriae FI3]